jgi:hypothetical protein
MSNSANFEAHASDSRLRSNNQMAISKSKSLGASEGCM